MRLENITLKNFRRFKELSVSIHPKLTVLAALNGQGKTSILDAATIGLGTFVGAFDLGKATAIKVSDARYKRLSDRTDSEQIFPVSIELEVEDPEIKAKRELTGVKNRTTTKDAQALTEYGKHLMQSVREMSDVNLPLVAYYGSGRLWNAHKNTTRKSVLSESRTMGYEDCFTSASSFTQVQQWMSKASFAEVQQKSMPGYDGYTLSEQIEGIQGAVDRVLVNEGWSNFHYSFHHEELAIFNKTFGVMPVAMLSDGVRAMVSLVADLAWRCAKLNPHLGRDAQKKAQGVVFIDEVDMHLHPQWQQTVIKSLQSAFPNLQLIVTTHSPQVLSTVPSESIRLIRNEFSIEDAEWSSSASQPSMQSRGVASSDVMAELQLVDPIPDVEEARWLHAYKALIAEGTAEEKEGKDLARKLLNHFGEDHPVWLECERLIRFQAMKSKLPRRNG